MIDIHQNEENKRIVIDILRLDSRTSLMDIYRRTGIPVSTAYDIMNRLRREGLVFTILEQESPIRETTTHDGMSYVTHKFICAACKYAGIDASHIYCANCGRKFR